MKLSPAHAAAIASALIVMTCQAPAVTFDERWSSLFGVTQMTNETVSAKAELVRSEFIRSKEIKRKVDRRSRYKRHHFRRGREFRHREWYKGGKRWHYVYSRKRAR